MCVCAAMGGREILRDRDQRGVRDVGVCVRESRARKRARERARMHAHASESAKERKHVRARL